MFSQTKIGRKNSNNQDSLKCANKRISIWSVKRMGSAIRHA